eukprot:1731073-Amphidinium_carterae.1
MHEEDSHTVTPHSTSSEDVRSQTILGCDLLAMRHTSMGNALTVFIPNILLKRVSATLERQGRHFGDLCCICPPLNKNAKLSED